MSCFCFAFGVLLLYGYIRVCGPVASALAVVAGDFVVNAALRQIQLAAFSFQRLQTGAAEIVLCHQSPTPRKLSRTFPPGSSNSTV